MARTGKKINWKTLLICLASVGVICTSAITITASVKDRVNDNDTNIEQEAPETENDDVVAE